MSVYSKKTSKSRKSTRSTRTNQTRHTQNTIRTKLLSEIKSKHGFTNTQAWHIKASLLERIETPNPFNKLISSHDKLSNPLQSSICSTLSTVIETIINKKSDNDINMNNDNNTIDTEIDMIDASITVTYTELFAVFMTLLETNNKSNNNYSMSIIILLSYLIHYIPINILLNQFDKLSSKLGEYLYEISNKNDSQIGVEYCINCMSEILIKRIKHNINDIRLWNNKFCQKMLQGLFVLSTDEIGTIRKLSLKHIKKIFKLYDTNNNKLPLIIKNLQRCFIERQIEGILNENNNNDKVNKIDLNIIGFISELLMDTLEYLTLKESSYIITLLFNVISYCMQMYGDNTIQIKHINLQQMFLKLILKFIKSLPNKWKTQIANNNNNENKDNDDMNIDELANQLKDKIDLKKLVNTMKIDDIQDNDDNNDKYVKFITQLFDVIQQLKPQKTDSIGIPIYYDCLVAIISTLYEFNTQEALNRCICIITIIFDGFESNKKRIVEKASKCIIEILEIIVNDELISDTKNKLQISDLPTLSPHTSYTSLDDINNKNKNKLPILQRIIILIESLLDFKYKSSWIYIYSLCNNLFRIFNENGFFLLCNILSELSEIRCMNEPIFITHLEDTISAAIKYCGPKNVLNVIPMNLPTNDTLQLITLDKAILKANLWILPLLKHNVNRTNLSFFGERLLPIADMMMKQRDTSIKNNLRIASKQFDSMCHMIWNIFPSFCIYPKDFSITFPQIAESIAYYLINIIEVRPYIIHGFIHLIKKPLEFIKKQNEKGIFENDMIKNAKLQINVLKKYTKNYLKILCNILIKTKHDKRYNILKAIGLFAEIADKQYIQAHFKRTMEKCLQEDIQLLLLRKEIMDKFDANEAEDDDSKLDEIKQRYESLLNKEIAYLLILNQMIGFIDINELEQFWSFLKQQFQKTDQSPLIQKLLYKNLYSILNYRDCVLLQDSKQLMNFIQFMLSLNNHVKILCIGAKHQRLNCIHSLFDCLAEYELDKQNKKTNDIRGFIEDDSIKNMNNYNVNNINEMKRDNNSFINIYPEFIGELISNVALGNLKIRKISLEIIELIGQRLEDISNELLNKFILKLLGGLLSKTSNMQSATILCLTYLIVQFELRISPQILSELLKTISLRIVDPSNSVIKASLDFTQIIIQEMPDSILENNLMDLLTTLLKWMGVNGQNKFKYKINKCIDLLLKRFGYEKIIKLVPNRFQRLIKYLRKRADYIKNKREKKKKLEREDKLNAKILNKKLENLPPDHPLNVNEGMDDDNSSDEDDGKLTVFDELKTERIKNKSKKSIHDLQSVRMKIDDDNNIMDLSSKISVKKGLISEYEANKMVIKQKKINELGIMEQKMKHKGFMGGKGKDKHIHELSDGRLLITLSDDDNDRNYKTKTWKNLSDEEKEDSDSDLYSSDDNQNNKRDVDDILSQYSKYNKMTQLKKALADVSTRRSHKARNKRISMLNNIDVINKRRKILNSVKNDEWLPGQLQPYAFHQLPPSIINRKKKHFKQSTFQRVMGKKRSVMVRTDNFATNSLKISRTRKIGHGRYTLKRSQIKAKQKHLVKDIHDTHMQNKMRRRAKLKSRSKSRGRSKSKRRGVKRRLDEI